MIGRCFMFCLGFLGHFFASSTFEMYSILARYCGERSTLSPRLSEHKVPYNNSTLSFIMRSNWGDKSPSNMYLQ